MLRVAIVLRSTEAHPALYEFVLHLVYNRPLFSPHSPSIFIFLQSLLGLLHSLLQSPLQSLVQSPLQSLFQSPLHSLLHSPLQINPGTIHSTTLANFSTICLSYFYNPLLHLSSFLVTIASQSFDNAFTFSCWVNFIFYRAHYRAFCRAHYKAILVQFIKLFHNLLSMLLQSLLGFSAFLLAIVLQSFFFAFPC